MSKILNLFKTGALFAVLTAILMSLGYVFFGGTTGALIFLVISAAINIGMFWYSDKIALKMSRSVEIDETQYPQIFQMARDLTGKMEIPMPRLYISPEMQPNAFATGRSPKNSAVSFTQGLVENLSYEEIEGVFAHELAHIKNRDTLISTLAAIFAGAVSNIANIGIFFGGSDDNNPLVSLLLIIVAPIAAMLIQLAISRSREYQADATAAKYTGNPSGLSNALRRIEGMARQAPMNVNPSMSSLYISNPLKSGFIGQLFSTHPPTEKRVQKLNKLAYATT